MWNDSEVAMIFGRKDGAMVHLTTDFLPFKSEYVTTMVAAMMAWLAHFGADEGVPSAELLMQVSNEGREVAGGTLATGIKIVEAITQVVRN